MLYNHNNLSLNLFFISFISLIALIGKLNSQCATFFPRTASQCHNYSDEENFCCFLTRFKDKTAYNICHSLPVSQYADISEVGYLLLGVNNYTEISCGTIPGADCGDGIPIIPEDCYTYSSSSSNCCMISISNRKNRCVFSGNTLKAYYTTDNGITIKCDSYFAYANIVLVIILGLLYL